VNGGGREVEGLADVDELEDALGRGAGVEAVASPPGEIGLPHSLPIETAMYRQTLRQAECHLDRTADAIAGGQAQKNSSRTV
jgi:hypothetical protein